ncbi:MAG: SIMPL domain-containing protein [Gammaproteobacteria bacterium]|nr:SIMPL domain-containing protein [Gammaproteobacteria bacterium]
MKHRIIPIWMRLTFGILLIILLTLFCLNQIKQLGPAAQIMRVSAEGKIMSIPDLATVTLGVVSQGVNSIDIKNQNSEKINKIIALIKQQGIDPQYIKTSGFYASPTYNTINGQNTITGYQVDQTITIQVYNIDKSQERLEKILDSSVNNGANEIRGIYFSFADVDKLKILARKQAIAKAKEKALQLTSEAGLKLGRILNVVESSNEFSPAPYSAVAMSARTGSNIANIEPGNKEVTDNITLIFEVY